LGRLQGWRRGGKRPTYRFGNVKSQQNKDIVRHIVAPDSNEIEDCVTLSTLGLAVWTSVRSPAFDP